MKLPKTYSLVCFFSRALQNIEIQSEVSLEDGTFFKAMILKNVFMLEFLQFLSAMIFGSTVIDRRRCN